MKSFSLFPSINKKKAVQLFTISEPQFSYTVNGKSKKLVIDEPDSSISSISDEDGLWNPIDYNLIIHWHVKYNNGEALFGYDPYDTEGFSCACHNADIGIALVWCSRDSRRRETIPVDKVYHDKNAHDVTCSYEFPKSSLRGKVTFSIILYVKNEGTPEDDELLFANTQGMVIGHVAETSIVLDGNGSYFTINAVSRPGEALWAVEYNMDDPAIDSFSENVIVYLNTANKNYRYLDKESEDFNIQLYIEVVSGVFINVIETVREQDESFNCLNESTEGSVAQAILYFKDVLEWDLSSPISLSNSIRRFFEKNINEI